MEYNYSPPQSIVNPDLSSTMDLNKSESHIKNLINFFFQQLDRIDKTESIMIEKARGFCQDLLKRNSMC